MIFRTVLLSLISLFSITLNAQDVIHLLNGQKIKAQIIEVGIEEIIYKGVSGEETKVKKAEIEKINYKNGSQEQYNAAKPSANREMTEKPVQPSTKPVEQNTKEQKVAQKPIEKTATTPEESANFKKRLFLGINLGSSTPLGDYGDNSFSNSKAEYALTGINFNIDLGFELHKNFGVCTNLFSTAHAIDNNTFAKNYVAALASNPRYVGFTTTVTVNVDPSSLSGLLFGGYVQVPVTKFAFLFRLMGGYVYGTTGSGTIEETSTNNTDLSYGTASRAIGAMSSAGFGYNTGIGIRYNITNKLFVNTNLDMIGYTGSFSGGTSNTVDYSGISTTSLISPYEADRNIFNFTVGVGIKFGKK